MSDLKYKNESEIIHWSERLLTMLELEFKQFTEEYVIRDDATINLDTWQMEWEIIMEVICDELRDIMRKKRIPSIIIVKVICGVPRNLLSWLKTKDFWAPKGFWESLEYVRYSLRSAGDEKKNETEMSKVHQKENVESEVDEGKTKVSEADDHETKSINNIMTFIKLQAAVRGLKARKIFGIKKVAARKLQDFIRKHISEKVETPKRKIEDELQRGLIPSVIKHQAAIRRFKACRIF